MVNKVREPRRLEALLAGLLLLSFFLPWLYSMGAPVAAHQIRERLAGPHRFISAFSAGSRVTRDYHLSLCLYAIPVCAASILFLIFIRRYRAWNGLLAGTVAAAAFIFLRDEVANFPFHRLATGPYLALASGLGLAVLPLFRLGSGKG